MNNLVATLIAATFAATSAIAVAQTTAPAAAPAKDATKESKEKDAKKRFGKALKIGLQAFAGLALFVGAFVIYNTFSVIVAQRLRELAVLAAIGATPKQIKRSLRFEGLVIGIIGLISYFLFKWANQRLFPWSLA